MRARLEAMSVGKGLAETVRFLGAIPDGDLPAYYQAADLFVLPTLALEGFGLATLEALACGTPCRHARWRDAGSSVPWSRASSRGTSRERPSPRPFAEPLRIACLTWRCGGAAELRRARTSRGNCTSSGTRPLRRMPRVVKGALRCSAICPEKSGPCPPWASPSASRTRWRTLP